MRRIVLVIGVMALAACDRSTASYRLAVGWSGAVPTWQGECKAAAAPGAAVEIDGGHGRAMRAGSVELDCASGKLRLEVATPTRITISPAGPLGVGSAHILRASAADDAGELMLGDAAVSWTLPPGLREGDRCSHMSGACLEPASVRVTADAAGSFPITVDFGGLGSTTTITFE